MIAPARAARLSTPRNAPASPRRAPRRGLPFNRGRPTLLPLAKPPAASAEDPLLPPPPPLDLAAVALTFAFPALGGALFGYDIGATSGALPSLRGAASGAAWAAALTPVQAGAVVSSSLVGALLGSALAFAIGDKIGRKAELVVAGVLYAGAAAAAAAAGGLAPLLAARCVYGVAIGLAMHSAPAYISETAPAAVRGLLISLKEGAIVGGILAGYAASAAWGADVGGWRLMYGAAVAPALVLAVGTAALAPDSPRWLLLAGKGEDRARSALARCRGTTATTSPAALDAEFDDMAAAAAEARSQGALSVTDLITQPRYRTPLLVGLSLVLMQQITGQPSVLYYAASIFEAAGFGGDAAAVAVGLGLFKLVATGAAVAAVDRAGRRPLLVGGVAAMAAALVALAAASGAGGAGAWASLVALLVYVGAYQISFGPITWLFVGEVFPLAARSRAAALATLTNFGANAAVSFALPSVQAAVGPAATYAGFAVIAAASVAVIWATVPETKGKTLEEIEAMFR